MTCAHQGCTLVELAGKNLCGTHFLRQLKGAPMDAPVEASSAADLAVAVNRRGRGLPACSVEGCNRPRAKRGFCIAHYSRQLRGKDMTIPIRGEDRMLGCREYGCSRPHAAKGLCKIHYLEQWRERVGVKTQVCTVPGCDRKRDLSGKLLCPAHDARRRKGMDMDPPIRGYRRHEGCRVEGCDRPHRARGLCSMHYKRARRKGEFSS